MLSAALCNLEADFQAGGKWAIAKGQAATSVAGISASTYHHPFAVPITFRMLQK
jgi:hypothetical protein